MPTSNNTAACFWGLLTTDEFKFLYLPSFISDLHITNDKTIKDVIFNRSIFELMHPNEVELAKADFNNFVKLKTLSGSITRCRFRSLKNHLRINDDRKGKSPIKENETIWNIVDLVIYTVTNESVLVFFHNIDFTHYELEKNLNFTTCCSGENNNFHLQEAECLASRLKEMGLSEKRTATIPFNVFKMKDKAIGDNLFTWPQYDDQSTSLIQAVESLAKNMPLCEFKSCSSVDNTFPVDNHTKVHLTDGIINCTHHFYASKKMDFNNETCFFERIVIPYGPVVFEAFQIRIAPSSPLPPYPSSYSYINNLIPDPVIAWPKGRTGNTAFDSIVPTLLFTAQS